MDDEKNLSDVSQAHRIVWERDFKGLLVQTVQHLQQDQVPHSPVQPHLGYFHGWGIHHL